MRVAHVVLAGVNVADVLTDAGVATVAAGVVVMT